MNERSNISQSKNNSGSRLQGADPARFLDSFTEKVMREKFRANAAQASKQKNSEPRVLSSFIPSSPARPLQKPGSRRGKAAVSEPGGGSMAHAFKIQVRVNSQRKSEYRVLDLLSSVIDGINGEDLTPAGLSDHTDSKDGWVVYVGDKLVALTADVSANLQLTNVKVDLMSESSYKGRVELNANGEQTKLTMIIGKVGVDENDRIFAIQGIITPLMITHAFYNGALVKTAVASDPSTGVLI